MLDALGEDRDLAWLHRATRVPLNTLRDYVRDGITRADNAERIAGALEISLDWLLAGREGPPPAGGADMIRVPLQDVSAAAGAGAAAVDSAAHQADWLFPREWLARSFGQVDGLRIIRIVGDSQEPDFSEGDWIMIDTNRTDLRDGLHVVRLDGMLMLKRVQVQGRIVQLTSRNPAYDPIPVDLQDEERDFAIIGRMVWSSKVHVAG